MVLPKTLTYNSHQLLFIACCARPCTSEIILSHHIYSPPHSYNLGLALAEMGEAFASQPHGSLMSSQTRCLHALVFL